LAHQPGIQDAFVKPGLILGNVERHSRYRQQLERLCRPAWPSSSPICGMAVRFFLVPRPVGADCAVLAERLCVLPVRA
jgi:hypothetical protein